MVILGNEARIKGISSTLTNEQLYTDGNEGLCFHTAHAWRRGKVPFTEGSWKHIRDVVTMQMRKTVVFGWFRGLVKGVTFQLVGEGMRTCLKEA